MRSPILMSSLALAACLGPSGTFEDATDHGVEPDPLGLVRIDRMGRVEVTNFMLCFQPFHCSDETEVVKDAYNAEDAFALSEQRTHYASMLESGLQYMDSFDERGGLFDSTDLVDDWPSPHPLVDTLLEDYLIVDVTQPCDVSSPSYLALELEAVAGLPVPSNGACGGRTPNDDVIDRTQTVLINGPARLHVPRRDGVDAPDQPATMQFPYLAPPDGLAGL
jgi:hypothetical protein